MDPTQEQVADWKACTTYWVNKTRPQVKKTIFIYKIAEIFQQWLELHGMLFADVFTSSDKTRVKSLIDTYNRVDNSIAKVDLGVYALGYHEDGIISIVAPVGMNPEEYQNDQLASFGVGPLIPIIIKGLIWGATIVGGLWQVKGIVHEANKPEALAAEAKLMEGKMIHQVTKNFDSLTPEMQKLAMKKLLEYRPELAAAGLDTGWLDKLLGAGTGKIIGIAIAAGILLYAYSKRSKK